MIRRSPLRYRRHQTASSFPGFTVEALEVRALLDAVLWDGGGDGTSWTDPLNWDTNVVPGAADDVTINVAGTPTIQLSSSQSINSLSCDETFNLGGGTLTLAAASTINGALTLSGGFIGGSGNVAIAGAVSWTGGGFSGTGVKTLQPTATVSMTGGNIKDVSASVVNQGAMIWTDGDMRFFGGTLDNQGTFTINISVNDVAASGMSGVNTFINSGTFTKQGIRTAFVRNSGTSLPFNNTSSVTAVSVQGGTLALNSGGTQTNDFAVSSGATMRFGGTHTLSAAVDITGAGSLTTSGNFADPGIVNITGTYTLDGGTTDFNGSFNGGCAIVVSNSGTANFNSNVPVAFTTATIDSSGVIGGSGNVAIAGAVSWTQGGFSGTGVKTLQPTATVNITGGNFKDVSASVVNQGAMIWTDGDMRFFDGTLDNQGTFTINISVNDVAASGMSGVNTFTNSGTFTKQGIRTAFVRNSGTSLPFNNTSSVDVQNGTLGLTSLVTQYNSGTNTLTAGTWKVKANSTLNFPAGASIRTNAADVELESSTASFAAIMPLTTNSGSLTLRDGRPFNFTPLGNIFTVSSGGLLVKSGTGTTTVPSAITFRNHGIARVRGSAAAGTEALVLQSQGTHQGDFEIESGAALLVESSQTFDATSQTTGQGDLTLTAGASVFNGDVTLTGAVTLFNETFNAVFSADSMLIEGSDSGTFNGATTVGDAVLSGGTLTGSGAVTVTGEFDWSAGTLAGSGMVKIDPGATLSVFNGNKSTNKPLELRGTLTGASDLSIGSALSWLAGTMDGAGKTTIAASASLDISGAAAKSLRRTLEVQNLSTANWMDGAIQLNNGLIDVKAGATFNLRAADSISLTAGTALFKNAGTVTQDVAAATQINIPFDNSGSVSAARRLVFGGGGTVDANGSFSASAPTGELAFTGTAYTFQGGPAISGSGNVAFEGAVHTVNRAIDIDGTLKVKNAQTEVTLTQDSNVSRLEATAGAHATLAASLTADTAIDVAGGSRVTVATNGSRVLRCASVSIEITSSVIDLFDNAMIVNYDGSSPLLNIEGNIRNGYAGGSWTGNGIISSIADFVAGSFAVGYAESSAIFSTFPATFAGQQVDNTAVLVRYTRYGDADLNKTVNLNDFNRLAGNFGQSNTVWSQGNFNFDSVTNLSDFNRLAANFGQTASPVMRGNSSLIGQSIFKDDMDEDLS